jgi:formylglycine-generating enzyme required for sulfatase activity
MKQLYFLIALMLITITSFAQSKHKPGQTFKDCKDCPEMVVIPAGSFMMGSPENEPGRFSNPDEGPVEGPQRLVNVRQFAAGKFDITKKQWAAFVKATDRPAGGGCGWAHLPGEDSLQPWLPRADANWNHVGFEQDSSHPVICMSWTDAHDYAEWLGKKTGFTYRLLSEAEWEYAARAGTTTPYSWGTTASREYANYGRDSVAGFGYASGHDSWICSSPVGSFPPNQFGLYDMNGNVLQWVDDCFSKTYEELPTDGSAYKKDMLLDSTGKMSWMIVKTACAFHMIRGGCYGDPPRMLRSAFRNWGGLPGAMTPDLSRSAGGGFRVARTL